jgi:hypothetical protein
MLSQRHLSVLAALRAAAPRGVKASEIRAKLHIKNPHDTIYRLRQAGHEIETIRGNVSGNGETFYVYKGYKNKEARCLIQPR